MESWTDIGIVINARPHGENGAVVTLLTEENGLHAGFLPGAMSKSKQGLTEQGTLVKAEWQARLQDYLGRFRLESEKSLSAPFLADHKRLLAMKSACALCRTTLPEREACPAQFYGLEALLKALSQDDWPSAYIAWEIGFLNEQGGSLDFSRCAATGQEYDLIYISPKSGRAVSRKAGAPYKSKLLPLPDFLKSEDQRSGEQTYEDQIRIGLNMTGYFIEEWLYGQTTRPVPDERMQLVESFQQK